MHSSVVDRRLLEDGPHVLHAHAGRGLRLGGRLQVVPVGPVADDPAQFEDPVAERVGRLVVPLAPPLGALLRQPAHLLRGLAHAATSSMNSSTARSAASGCSEW